MNFIYTERFEQSFSQLAPNTQKIAKRKLQLLLSHPAYPFYPSLRIKRIKGTKNIWEGSINMNIRITFQFKSGNIILRNIGPHDIIEAE